MKNERSLGITILGRTIVIFSLFALFGSLNQMNYLSSSIRPFGVFFSIVVSVQVALTAILGFYILKLKEWARKYFVILNMVFIGILFIQPLVVGKSYFLSTDDYVQQYRQQLTPEQLSNYDKLNVLLVEKSRSHTFSKERRQNINNTVSKMLIPGIILAFFWFLFMIFFFSRPSVKEQFR